MHNIIEPDVIDINAWKNKLRKFVDEREWRKFNNPKNLAMNLVGEAAELMEIFTWINSEHSIELKDDPDKFSHIKQEVGDVLITLIILADELGINLSASLAEKVRLTAIKYPVTADD